MKKNNATLKSYFETGDYPTEAQFVDLIDSFLNIEEEDAVTGIADNGDGTFTFQLLSGGQVTLNGATIPDDIPIANILGLQALLDASAPGNFLAKDQDENTTGGLSIDMAAFGDGKSFSIGAQGVASYLSMDANGNAIFGNVSSNDGQDSSLVIKRNGSLEFNDNGTPHTVWHSGNDGAGSGLDADTLDGLQASVFVRGDGNSGTRFDSTYLQFGGDGVSNNDYISYNDATNAFYFNADTNRQNSVANAGVFAGSFNFNDAATKLTQAANDAVRLTTPTGYLEFGSKNTSHCHFYTDRSNFYFNKELRVDSGNVGSYDEDLNLNRAGSSTARLRITTGTTFSDQAFNIMGDLSLNGAFLNGDGKSMLQYNDAWLRLNPSNEFTSGIYCGSGVFRADGQLEVGPSGNRFKVQTNGDAIFNYNAYGKSLNNGYSNLYRWGGIYFTWDSDSYGTNTHHSIRSTYGDAYGDSLTMNSFGHIRLNIDSNGNGTNRFEIGRHTTGTGNVLFTVDETGAATASNFILNSDRRLKEEIEDVKFESLPIRWRTFKMKKDETKQVRFGVIAQELKMVAPDFVNSDKDGNLTVKYIDLLVAKISELEERINLLE